MLLRKNHTNQISDSGAKICERRIGSIAVGRGFVNSSFSEFRSFFIDLLMGLFRRAVFRHGGGARKQPIKQATETPTSTLALMGRFHSLMGRFPALMGRFTDFVLRGRFTS